ncbi:hypothetical protein FRACYDRAFT_237502 [Fragilariopsis cylindrus CCMP1102]|uniref:Uncharacterized protein n=1 Tax=Fragilariopsis cylindrus CCMP1102 TaxID=635003 RepID=A0A1E7FG24_9STRA|nr:hypothetical protein FRACYDRAFT_237502 [Fragilariopsis cylindrus CCMP1102]|eukprot:OEU17094.1 hypothetical protein FRACYDRAFT_237502 [Fragilariopsis cylindrus CCMP1102]
MEGSSSNNEEESPPSAAGRSSSPGSAGRRWTCEACGCNTNSESDRSCTICGTSQDNAAREPVQRLEPDELLRAARDNDSVYQPKWMNPSQIGGRMRTGNGIEVGDGANQNVAYLPLGSGEGRALRALEAFPRSAPFASFSLSSSTSSSLTSNNSVLSGASGQERKPRRVFGFKVAFAHPSKENGENLGGCYLIGVTNTSFSSFSEKNALQQSPFFFGIEDGGNKYEGTRSQSSTAREGIRSRRRSTYAVELREDEASRNDDGVLFGSRDSMLDYFAKKVPRKQNTRESSILKSATDDDGMPLLQLAITLGCSLSVIKELIRCGAPVKEIEIQLAANLDLPDILSTLLMHQVYSDGMIDLENCSSSIAAIVHDARKRQDSQHKRLRKEAESFLVSFSRKLVQICLKRRQQQQGNDTCGRAIACALVGNVELCALRKRHKIVSSTSTSSDVNEESINSTISERGTSEPCGLMQALPVFILEGERPDSSGRGQRKAGKRVLKRTWSALASIESMCPVGVSATSDNQGPPSFDSIKFKLSLDGRNIDIYVEDNSLEFPPSLEVRFSSPQILSPVNVSASDTTLISLLFQLYQDEECDFFRDDEAHQIFYSVILQPSKGEEKWFNQVPTPKKTEGANSNIPMIVNDGMDMALKVKDDPTQKQYLWSNATCSRSRKLSHTTNYSDCDELGSRCDGLDEICIQCIEVIELLARVNSRLPKNKRYDTSTSGSIFVNQTLSQKLTKQSEDPLFVVGGIAPEWCLAVPAFAPNIFSYASRKLLLDRVAFGVSRSTLRQQDAKVNVGRLRQRMNSLRARAVELMADAFSGDVEDPTALQLQADELYGMEDALATRVRASFRAEGWEEMTLQVAKAAIHRKSLLSDAMSIMKQFCSDPRLNRRRLEIRFDGESGFDASTGDEAGVTRGFYADVAESLLSCDLVAGVSCSLSCASLNNLQKNSPSIAFKHSDEPLKLPLWIPDIDASVFWASILGETKYKGFYEWNN